MAVTAAVMEDTVEAEEVFSAPCLAECSGRRPACGCTTTFLAVPPAGAVRPTQAPLLPAWTPIQESIPITPAPAAISEPMTVAVAAISAVMTAGETSGAAATLEVGIVVAAA